MEEISNKTIVVLLIGAIIISLGGTLISLNKLAKIKTVSITGFAPGDRNVTSGNVSLTISDITWINFSLKMCYLGSGYVTRNKCELNSSGSTNGYNISACSPSFGVTNTCTGLQIKNIGNNNVSLNISFKNNSAFIQPAGGEIWFKMMNGTTTGTNQGCLEASGTRKLGNFERKWNEVVRAGETNTTCSRFFYGNTANTVSIHLRVRVQQGVPQGVKQNVITATGLVS
jgi:hypothetical protein